MKKLLLILITSLFLIIAAGAKETVIYENDFSNSSLSDFTMYGDMSVANGALKAVARTASGPSAFISYTFPEQYQGKAYIVEADHIGRTSMGGLLIGANTSVFGNEPSYFSGYTCSSTENTRNVYIGFFNETGWGGGFPISTVTFNDIPDLHYKVKVQRGVMTFYTYKLGESTPLYVSRYEPGAHDDDIYETFSSTVGIRQYYADKGYFDNFKVTILEDDELPAMTDSVTLSKTAFASNGITVQNGVATGNGAMLSENSIEGSYRISFDLAAKDISRVYFGMSDEKNGYMLEINGIETALFLYRISNGEFTLLGEKENIIRDDFATVSIDVHSSITSVYYDNYYQHGEEFPKFEFYLGDTDGKIGFWLEGGKIKNLEIGNSTDTLAEETYLNPVNPGADPDVLYYDGVYYLYVYSSVNGDEVFRVYTSPDLVHFTERNIVFKWKDEYSISALAQSSWSPNVSYYDGKFYLFFAAQRAEYGGENIRSVYYATSDSPYGPFEFDGPLEAVNPNRLNEIDGHPFYDDDGRIYMSFSRYDEGGTIWVEEVDMVDGKVIQKPETDTRVIIPDREWENDGAMRLCEGGYIWKHEGYYYMIYATTSYARHYGEAYAVAKSPLGPYEKYDYNPFLIHNYTLDGPGDALIVPSPDGTELYLVYHRHYSTDTVHLRQTCIDLIEFVDNPDGGPDLITTRGPSSTPQKVPSHKYRYDVNRDGYTTLFDALTVIYNQDAGVNGYSGYYDADADGDVTVNDAMLILRESVK